MVQVLHLTQTLHFINGEKEAQPEVGELVSCRDGTETLRLGSGAGPICIPLSLQPTPSLGLPPASPRQVLTCISQAVPGQLSFQKG